MAKNGLAIKVKELRNSRNWTQQYLSKISGIPRVTLASIETDKIKNPSAEVFLKLARGFNIQPEELYKAAGYIKDTKNIPNRNFTPEELINLLRIGLPITIPVFPFNIYSDYGVKVPKDIEPKTYIFRPRTSSKKGIVIGFRVDINFLEPMISPGDNIILDSKADINDGDIVACLYDGKPHIGRLRRKNNNSWLENNHGTFKIDSYNTVVRIIAVIKPLLSDKI